MNCNTTHYRANSSSVPGDPTDRAVPSAGASDPDRKLRLPLGDIARQQKVEQFTALREERFERRIMLDKCADVGIITRQPSERVVIVGIAQEAHVEEQIEIDRQTELEAEGDERNAQTGRAIRGKRRRNPRFERRMRKIGGIDDDARALAEGGKRSAVSIDGFPK